MSWFGFNKQSIPKEKPIEYKDIDEDETEHTIEDENIDAFSIEEYQVDFDEGDADGE